jgi:hypothetical protein
MAKSRKKIKEDTLISLINKLTHSDTVNEPSTPKIEIYMPCEWMIQFDNDEPQLFTTADETVENPEVIIKIQNTNEGFIKFTDTVTGKTFKLFARPKL